MNYEVAFMRGVDDRNSGRPLIAHDDIPDGELWDAYMDGYTSVVGGPINACEADWLDGYSVTEYTESDFEHVVLGN